MQILKKVFGKVMKNIYRIANLNIGTSKWDSSYEFAYKNMHFSVERIGFDFEVQALKKMIHQLSSQVDAIAISGFPPALNFDEHSFIHRQYLDVLNEPSSIPICTGDTVSSISVIQGLNQAITKGEINPKFGVFFPCGLMSLDAIRALSETYAKNLYYGDAYVLAGIPKLIQHFDQIKPFARVGLSLANLKDIKRSVPKSTTMVQRLLRRALLEQLSNIENVYSRMGYLMFLEKDLEFIRNKTLIVPYSQTEMLNQIEAYGPKKIINLFPEPFQLAPDINYAVLDATLRLKNARTAALTVREWETLLETELSDSQTARRYVMSPSSSRETRLSGALNLVKRKIQTKNAPDFAFIVHPLALEDIARKRGLGALGALPRDVLAKIEKQASRLPGFEYGRIDNIVSKKTGEKVSGIIYTLCMTP
jgi:hypothetical protein